jgi:hypothetical protein
VAGNPKTLIVLKGQDNFEFFFEDDGESRYWRVRDHPDFPGWFLVEEFEDGWYVDSFSDKYENAGVEDLRGLLERLVDEPEATLEGLFGERIEVTSVVVRDSTE